MLELALQIGGNVLQFLFWWTCISIITLPFVLALLKANGPDREPARIRPRLIARDGEIVRR